MKAKLEISLSADEVAKAVGGVYNGKNTRITFICTDSRELEEGGLFFAIGKAEEYVAGVIGLDGCCTVSSTCHDAISVDDVEYALLLLAKYYKEKLPRLKLTAAITGSVGKTCVKDYTAAIFATRYKTHKTAGNFNNGIGLPLTVFSAPRDTEVLVLELGMNHFGEIKRLSEAVCPDIAAITCIGSAHIGNLGSREGIARAKLEILCGMSENARTVIPRDEPLLASVPHAITVGSGGDVYPEISKQSERMTCFKIVSGGCKSCLIRFPFGGAYLAENMAFASAIALASGLDMSNVNDAVRNISAFIPRQKYIMVGNITVLDDSYNASLESYVASLGLLSLHRGVKSAVIGDILELGEKSEQIHRRVGALCAELGIDKIYPFGRFSPFVKSGAEEAGFDPRAIFANGCAADHGKTAVKIINNAAQCETVLIKGSHAVHTEKIIECMKMIEGDKNAF